MSCEHDLIMVIDGFNVGVFRCSKCHTIMVYQDGTVLESGIDEHYTALRTQRDEALLACKLAMAHFEKKGQEGEDGIWHAVTKAEAIAAMRALED